MGKAPSSLAENSDHVEMYKFLRFFVDTGKARAKLPYPN